MLLPRFAVVGAQDDDLPLPAPQRGEVGHLDDHRAVVVERGRPVRDKQQTGGQYVSHQAGQTRCEELLFVLEFLH